MTTRQIRVAHGTIPHRELGSRPDHAERLAKDIPNAQVRTIAGARTFAALDQPVAVASLIREFATVAA